MCQPARPSVIKTPVMATGITGLLAASLSFSMAPGLSPAAMRQPPPMMILPPEFSEMADPAIWETGVVTDFDFFAASVGVGFIVGFAGRVFAEVDEIDITESEVDIPKADFGWLQADMRVPLPTFKELQSACHLIGSDEEHNMYLCAEEEPNLESCTASDDFSMYYGKTVFICRGGLAPKELN